MSLRSPVRRPVSLVRDALGSIQCWNSCREACLLVINHVAVVAQDALALQLLCLFRQLALENNATDDARDRQPNVHCRVEGVELDIPATAVRFIKVITITLCEFRKQADSQAKAV